MQYRQRRTTGMPLKNARAPYQNINSRKKNADGCTTDVLRQGGHRPWKTKRGRPDCVMNWQPTSKQNPEIGRIDLRHDLVTLNRKEVNTDETPESRTGKAGATHCTRRCSTRWGWRFQNRNRLAQRRVAPVRRQVARRQDRNRLRDQGGEVPRLQDRNRLPEPQRVQDRNPLREQGFPRLQ